jgi:hypothetical protein
MELRDNQSSVIGHGRYTLLPTSQLIGEKCYFTFSCSFSIILR